MKKSVPKIRKGSHNGDIRNFFEGEIDEMRVWNVARTEAQIKATMSSSLTGSEPGLVAYWRFNFHRVGAGW